MKKYRLEVSGMTCASCEIILERKIKQIVGVVRVKAMRDGGRIIVESKQDITDDQFHSVINDGTYQLVNVDGRKFHVSAKNDERTLSDWIVGVTLLIVGYAIYLFIRERTAIEQFMNIQEGMGLGVIFGLGVIASLSTCIAVTGGLVLGVSAAHARRNGTTKGIAKFVPHIYFNMGRVASYTLLGGVIGGLGSLFTISPFGQGIITLIAGGMLILLGGYITGIFRMTLSVSLLPKKITHAIHDMTERGTGITAAMLGALTFFLPCGFTQALQLFVVSRGDALQGGLIMGVFALGTTPVLFGLGSVTNVVKGEVKKHLLTMAGLITILFGIGALMNAGPLLGIAMPSLSSPQAYENTENVAQLRNGKQYIEMTIDYIDYSPHQFVVQKGVPVEWKINSTNAAGCMTSLVSSGLGINQYLGRGVTTVRFTPTRVGNFPFSCSMGMGTYGAKIQVIE